MMLWDRSRPLEMSAHEALKLLRRQGLASRQEARQMRAVLREDLPVPKRLHPLCERMWLAQTPPISRRMN